MLGGVRIVVRAVAVVVVGAFAVGVFAVAHAQLAVTTWHYDTFHSGANTNETFSGVRIVNSTSFGKEPSGLSVDAATADGPFIPGTNLGQSVFKLSQAGKTLQLSDWFTPYNQAYLDRKDLDLNEPVLVLPDQSGRYPHLAAAIGKEGTIYLLNRDNMGRFCGTCVDGDSQIVQELKEVAPETGALLFWDNAIYTSAADKPISGFALTNGALATTPFAQSRRGAAGHSPMISSNGTTNGVLWQINGFHLDAFNANTLVRLYSTLEDPSRDALPTMPHFSNFMVNNGKVYIGTNNNLVVFGLL